METLNFRTVADLNTIIENNLSKIPQNIDLIVGIPKSGMLPATLIALYLNLPLTDIDSLKEGKIYQNGYTKVNPNWISDINNARKILIVDDSVNSGQSLDLAKEKVKKSNLLKKSIFLSIFVTDKSKKMVDIYFDICPMPRVFEWDLMHHAISNNCCFDIDGVLCEDPTEEQNDDGKKYKNFLKNSKIKHRPTFEIGYLVSSRLEKYRPEIEFWLKKNKIKYKKLFLLDVPDKETRIKLGCHANFKAKIYSQITESPLFIESEPSQAKKINELTGKPVFCNTNSTFYNKQKNIPITPSKNLPVKTTPMSRIKNLLIRIKRNLIK